jgi:Pyridoxamine 5'-phosphate oxidase
LAYDRRFVAECIQEGFMGKIYPALDDRLRKFISRQSVFFVATAPCLTPDGGGGHVNVSPKGCRDTFAVLGPHRVAYLDLTGSGAETIAHLRQNGQITIMFCSFDHETKIVRLYGRGTVAAPGSARWDELARHFPAEAGLGTDRRHRRAIIDVEIDRIADSCGYAVPVMELADERDLLTPWAEKKTLEELAEYRVEKNSVSIDGLPALDPVLDPALDPAVDLVLDPALDPGLTR